MRAAGPLNKHTRLRSLTLEQPTPAESWISWPPRRDAPLAVFAGAQTFAALRRTAEARLGTRFDEREFDRTVLEGGDLPLDLVELQVEEFLKARPSR